MNATVKPKPPDPDQQRRFVETARALGVDEDEGRFREKLRVIARQKPKDEAKAKKGGSASE
jgi:hypothetical protein